MAPQDTTAPVEATNHIFGWEFDPVSLALPSPPLTSSQPLIINAADLAPESSVFPFVIKISIAPPLGRYDVGTGEYRYWVARETLGRASYYWGSLVPPKTRWVPELGERLQVSLEVGDDFNASYDRECLSFCKGKIGQNLVFAGESPDLLCHEFGHAVLDALRPDLWNVANIEVASFHEAFGDLSAILCALQLPSVREQVLEETRGRLYRTSRLSRFAEQLGWAIRQNQPDRAEFDCLRNAVNSFFYFDPSKLPPGGPASILSSEPHMFARIFTGGFFEAMSFMLRAEKERRPDEQLADVLKDVSRDAGQLLVDAVLATPLVPAYLSQLSASLLKADENRFGNRYHPFLKAGLVRHGLLSPEKVATVQATQGAEPVELAERVDTAPVPITLTDSALSTGQIMVHTADQTAVFRVTGAAPDIGSVRQNSPLESAQSFLEDLVRFGRIEVQGGAGDPASVLNPFSAKTHAVIPRPEGPTLQRLRFDCGVSLD